MKVLIFLHIPKAAGSILHTIINRQFPPKTIFNIKGDRVQESIQELKNLSEKERKKIKCLKGHMPFGLHKYLLQPCTYITLLRDPIDRIISHYYYVLRTPTHYLYNKVVQNNMGLKEYVENKISPELLNGQVRLISGVEKIDSVSENEPVSIKHLEIAKKNLNEYFAAVGLSERFDESLILFKKILGWKNIYYVKRNVARMRPSMYEIDRETLKVIEKYNELDIELYNFATQIFEKLIREQGESFEREVKRFQFLNRVYFSYASSPLNKTIRRIFKR